MKRRTIQAKPSKTERGNSANAQTNIQTNNIQILQKEILALAKPQSFSQEGAKVEKERQISPQPVIVKQNGKKGFNIEPDYSLLKDEYIKFDFAKLESIGDPESLFERGHRLANGFGCEKNGKVGWILIYEAAICGHPIGMALVLTCAYQDIERDDKRSVEILKKCAEYNHSCAMFNLGVCYVQGVGVDKNFDEACRWFGEASKRRYYPAMFNYANALCSKIGTSINLFLGYYKFYECLKGNYYNSIICLQAMHAGICKIQEYNKNSKKNIDGKCFVENVPPLEDWESPILNTNMNVISYIRCAYGINCQKDEEKAEEIFSKIQHVVIRDRPDIVTIELFCVIGIIKSYNIIKERKMNGKLHFTNDPNQPFDPDKIFSECKQIIDRYPYRMSVKFINILLNNIFKEGSTSDLHKEIEIWRKELEDKYMGLEIPLKIEYESMIEDKVLSFLEETTMNITDVRAREIFVTNMDDLEDVTIKELFQEWMFDTSIWSQSNINDDYHLGKKNENDIIRRGLKNELGVCKGYKIMSVHKIKNDELMEDYEYMKRKLRKKRALHKINTEFHVECFREWQQCDDSVGELVGFHGTGPDSVIPICTEGFDNRITIAQLRDNRIAYGYFGAAISIGENASKADEYANEDLFGVCTMFVTRCVMGIPFITACDARTNPLFDVTKNKQNRLWALQRAPYMKNLDTYADSIAHVSARQARNNTSWPTKNSEFAVYDRMQIIPEYVIRYVRI